MIVSLLDLGSSGSDKQHSADAFGRNQHHQHGREKDGQSIIFAIIVFDRT